MAIDWANEPYVRLYKRETDDDLLLSWEARAVWHEMLKRFDRSGLLETRRGVRGLAAMIRVPLEVVERVLPELLEDGRVHSIPNAGFASRNYITANDTPRSDKARQMESRNRRIQSALSSTNIEIDRHDASRDVTNGHGESRAVTHIISDQIISDHQSPAGPAPGDSMSALRGKCDALNAPLALTAPPEPKKRGRKASASVPIPDDWEPRDQERRLAVDLGLDCDSEAAEFRTYWIGEGRTKKDWHATFANRLYSQAKRTRWPQQAGRTAQSSSGVRKLKDL